MLRPPLSPASSPAPGATPQSSRPLPIATGDFVEAFGGRYYRIVDVDALPPFFISLASASDLWAFIASSGALTAGRTDAEGNLFAYQSVDRIYDQVGRSGPFTTLVVARPDGPVTWQPFAPRLQRDRLIRRNLYKSIEGDRLWFEELHVGLGLCFRTGWATAASHGLVRTCELVNLGDAPVEARLLDGLLNVQPAGLPRRVQDTSSCLADAYKTAEMLEGSSLAVYALSAGIVDRPIALESLRASIVWSGGLPGARVLFSTAQQTAWLDGSETAAAARCRGVRTHYLLSAPLALAPRASQSWFFVADTGLDQPEVARRRAALAAGTDYATVRDEIDATTRRLRTLVAQADGLQCGGDETATAHHFANVLFNVMRGGTFADGHLLPRDDFARYVAHHNHAAATRHAAFLAALPAELPRADLLARVSPLGDPDLFRLATEYLPLTFSRRHGDPSRPWNRFRIRLQDDHGRRLLAYEGNWRDIFQNWEALCCSYPAFFDAVVAKFLNASTADGYNPYRISQNGIDWEIPEPEDPWSSIGYWGDHQVIYLQKLLEWSARYAPDGLLADLRAPRFASAAVPYRLAPYEAMRRDPRSTIEFHRDAHQLIEQREKQLGADARLLPDAHGRVRHVNFVEKLLVLILARLTNFVPGGGIWMNTQRPEWNDANNALVGHGVSVVTLGYLRRMLHHADRHLVPALGSDDVRLSSHVAILLQDILAALATHRGVLDRPEIGDTERRALLDVLATAGTRYRAELYTGGPGEPVSVPVARIGQLVALALRYTDHTLAANRRADGLFHSYNLLEFADQPAALRLHHLAPMLEGQVSILSSGLLAPADAVALLRQLRASPLYRADQHSYVLYPDRQLPGFLERNVIPESAVRGCTLFEQLLAAGDRRLLARDADGRARFQAELANAEALDARLAALAREPRWAPLVAADADAVRAAYEQVFHHHAFTGRSGTMFGYEGLGCIYWHMVAKLLLAVQENYFAALAARDPAAPALAEIYYDIRAGLGFNKTPAEFGAFPTDPYSHTPGHSGAQQPGMTGQVKEEVLTRWGELGVSVEAGRLSFRPTLLRAGEFTTAPATPAGGLRSEPLPTGSLGFTLCGVPVVYVRSPGAAEIVVRLAGGELRRHRGDTLDAATSAALLARGGQVLEIEVLLGADYRPLP